VLDRAKSVKQHSVKTLRDAVQWGYAITHY